MRARIAASLILFLFFSAQISLQQSEWRTKQSAHFVYHFMSQFQDASKLEQQMKLSERHYEKITKLLGVVMKDKIQYYYYPSKDMMTKMTGNYGTGKAYCEKNELHSIYSYHPHEITHLIACRLGNPPVFLSEGFAVLYGWDTGWQGKPVDWWVRKYRNEKKYIPISSLSVTSSFRKYDDAITYPESGSFVEFLIDRYGIVKFKKYYSKASDKTIGIITMEVYGKSLKDLETLWLNSLSEESSHSGSMQAIFS
jgi:hypothetical protein